MVGTGGFEPPTPYTPSRCAARLRHVPLRPEPVKIYIHDYKGCQDT